MLYLFTYSTHPRHSFAIEEVFSKECTLLDESMSDEENTTMGQMSKSCVPRPRPALPSLLTQEAISTFPFL